MGSFNIRKADVNDANELQTCMHLAYSVYVDRMNVETLPPMQVDYQEEIEHYPVWIIEFNGQIIAGLILVFEDDYASLANIARHPDFQVNGLGKTLLHFAEKEATNRGYAEINLTTHKLFIENVAFYHKQGWTKVDQDQTKIYIKKYLT